MSKISLLRGSVILFVLALAIYSPYQLINSDSVAGFEALKGCMQTGRFNTVISPDPQDISRYDGQYLSWWTPGQYLAPFAIKYITGLSLGYSITILNLLCTVFGLLGFFRVFKYFKFSDRIVTFSLVLILTSNTVLYRFISYQGGESLSFLLFPWALYLFVSIKNLYYKTSI